LRVFTDMVLTASALRASAVSATGFGAATPRFSRRAQRRARNAKNAGPCADPHRPIVLRFEFARRSSVVAAPNPVAETARARSAEAVNTIR